MKNMLELPRQADFYKTTLIELDGDMVWCKKEDLIKYKHGLLNLRNIVDFYEGELKVNVIDEEKMPDYEKYGEELRNRGLSDPLSPFPITDPPTKQFKLKYTHVFYINGYQRMITDDFLKFQELYFNYLQKEKLDL